MEKKFKITSLKEDFEEIEKSKGNLPSKPLRFRKYRPGFFQDSFEAIPIYVRLYLRILHRLEAGEDVMASQAVPDKGVMRDIFSEVAEDFTINDFDRLDIKDKIKFMNVLLNFLRNEGERTVKRAGIPPEIVKKIRIMDSLPRGNFIFKGVANPEVVGAVVGELNLFKYIKPTSIIETDASYTSAGEGRNMMLPMRMNMVKGTIKIDGRSWSFNRVMLRGFPGDDNDELEGPGVHRELGM